MTVTLAQSELAKTVPCGHCEAKAGHSCVDWRKKPIRYSHSSRVLQAQKQDVSKDEWTPQPTLNNFAGDIDTLVSRLMELKAKGFQNVAVQGGYYTALVSAN
jgi:hypothetical protein